MANTSEAAVVSVPAEETDALVTVVVRGEGGTTYRHLVIEVGRFARATVVLDHVGTGTVGANVEMLVGDGAELTVVTLQDWDDDAVHLGAHAARLGRDAKLKHIAVTLGGETVRLLPTVTYAGTGGDAELFGLSFTDSGQHHEHRLFVDHAVSNCRSRVHYKSALQSMPAADGSPGPEAHAVWIGDVLIRAAALATDTYELNRNLVLSDGARADSVPNLEIETGEVTGAGHASATGRFDDEALFYLMARGIPAAEARRLVVRGFFAEIVAQIPLEDVRDRISSAVEDELAGVGL
jgi:Fe-S cluster assembly protein SufD